MKIFKRLKVVLIVVSLVVFFQSCNDEEDDILTNQENQQTSKLFDYIVKLGFNPESIVDIGEYYLVGDDIIFEKDYLEYAQIDENNPINKQAVTNLLISDEHVGDIIVKPHRNLPNSGNDNWFPQIEQAIDEWNEMACQEDSDLRMIYAAHPTRYNYRVDIRIRSDNGSLPNNVIAAASWPNGSKPGRTIIINLDFLNNLNVSNGRKIYNMVHELGHCIGFRHTNWQARNEPAAPLGANTVAGTNGNDPNSVMNGGTALTSWTNFSNGDRTGLENTYSLRNWRKRTPYKSGEIVNYNGNLYKAIRNSYRKYPNSNPTYWFEFTCANGCFDFTEYYRRNSYLVGAKVSYQGVVYIATANNYRKTPSSTSAFWQPYICN